MIHEDLTLRVLKACFQVSNELGAGFLESVYERALIIALCDEGLKADAQVPLRVVFRGQTVGDLYADIVVEDVILLEIKAAKKLAPEHSAQILNYLKATSMPVGLLVNFGNPRLEYRRFGNRWIEKGSANRDEGDAGDEAKGASQSIITGKQALF